MKKQLLAFLCLGIIVGCSKQQVNPTTSTDPRDKFVGVWDRFYTSKCKAGTSTGNGVFTITKSSTKSNVVILDYGLDAINKPEAIVNNDAISYTGLSTIFSDQSGNGKISSDGKKITVIGVNDLGAYVGVCTTEEVWSKR